jgi:sugar (pentulose or hexulose) kinase
VRELLLGIDVGTSFCKAVVLDAAGDELAQSRARTPWIRVATGAEIDPGALVRAVLAAAADAIADVPEGTVVAVGIAGMAETGVLLDAGGRPVSRAIAWHDVRGADEASEIAAVFGPETFAMSTGLPATPLCSLAKLRWQRSALSSARHAVRWLGVPEWVGRALGGAEVAELSLASRTGLLSLSEHTWWPDALAWLGVRDDFMAEPVTAGTSVGRIGEALPAARGAHITIAGHDHLTAMVGAGAHREGDVLHSSGTAEVFVRTVPAQLDRARIAEAVAGGVTVGWHVMPERWALLSGNELSVALAPILQLLGIDGQAARDELTAAASALGPEDGELRLEGVGGASTLTLHGIGPGTSPARVWRAALAAAAEVSAATLARSDAVGGPRRRIVATGGGTRGAAARDAKEQWLGPIEWSPVQEATARGAALLAGVAAEIYASVEDAPAVPRAGLSGESRAVHPQA